MTIDGIVLTVCCAIGLFALGMEVGKQNAPLMCPVVPGHEVVSTVAPDTCIYAQSIYGRSLRKVKL